MKTEVEFTCVDCGVDVIRLGVDQAPDPALCLECQVIRDSPEEDREVLRKAFLK